MDIDLTRQPVTDIHCFSFAPGPMTEASLARLFMAGGPTVKSYRPKLQNRDLDASVAYWRMLHELSTFLGTKGRDSQVLRKRNKRANHFASYVSSLFNDAGIERIALDNGIEPISFEEFRRFVPSRLYRVFRIEPMLKNLLESSDSFTGLLGAFEEKVRSAPKDGFVGFKTVVAYRTGLDIGNPSEADARRAFQQRKSEADLEWFGPRVKTLRDFLLHRVAELSGRLGTFLQIHTGLGDTDVVAEKCDPLLLKNFLKSEEASKTPVVLIHGGFPYTDEAAWLANVFPNVYFELSTPLPPIFLPPLSKSRFRRVLEMVPITRIVYGSDAIEIPENHWMSAKLAKQALGGALGDFVEKGILGEDEAIRGANLIFDTNARGLLGRS